VTDLVVTHSFSPTPPPASYNIAFTASGSSADANGVTGTGVITPAGAQTAGTVITVTVTLTGTAIDAGTHAVGLTSSTTGVTIAAPLSVTKAVTAGQGMATSDTYVFTFSMPASDVTNLVVTHGFSPLSTTTAIPTLQPAALALLGLVMLGLAGYGRKRWT
jgi:hypothetical protein